MLLEGRKVEELESWGVARVTKLGIAGWEFGNPKLLTLKLLIIELLNS